MPDRLVSPVAKFLSGFGGCRSLILRTGLFCPPGFVKPGNIVPSAAETLHMICATASESLVVRRVPVAAADLSAHDRNHPGCSKMTEIKASPSGFPATLDAHRPLIPTAVPPRGASLQPGRSLAPA